jgi:hypothetical protein
LGRQIEAATPAVPAWFSIGLLLPLALGALVSCGFWAWTRLKQRRIPETLEADPSIAPARQAG